MAEIPGILVDAGVYTMAAYNPRVVFTLHDASAQGLYVISTKPVIVIPEEDGSFLAVVSATENMKPLRGNDPAYKVRFEWQEPNMYGPNNGYIGFDLVEKLYVPVEGGNFGDLVQASLAPTVIDVWEGPTDNPAYRWWFNPETQELRW